MVRKGERPLYRGKDWKAINAKDKPKDLEHEWFKKDGKHESYLMVPATPNSILKRNIEERISGIGMKVKIIEKPGTKLIQNIKSQIKKPTEKCNDTECLICKAGGNIKLCRSKEIVYVFNILPRM